MSHLKIPQSFINNLKILKKVNLEFMVLVKRKNTTIEEKHTFILLGNRFSVYFKHIFLVLDYGQFWIYYSQLSQISKRTKRLSYILVYSVQIRDVGRFLAKFNPWTNTFANRSVRSHCLRIHPSVKLSKPINIPVVL